MFELLKLPYSQKALEPYISQSTLFYHYEKHHATYLNNLNQLIKGTDFENFSLEDIILKTKDNPDFTSIYNNAAQVWNHDFYWKSLSETANADNKIPKGNFKDLVIKSFGSEENLKAELKKAALGQFGSGWVWLVFENNQLKIIKTSNAINPLGQAQALLTIDVWEHAYYLDYQNKRAEYVENILNHIINWNFAIQNLNNF
ncbi:MAG: superoxide dismutase [Alphaproteobacteria bacterium]|nr:superoxide dismutase [Alphaproteobacteria bacterium]